MQYLIGEIFFCMVAAAIFAGAIGALLHSIFGQGRIRAVESTKNLEIERITGDLEAARRGQSEAKASSDAAIARIKEMENRLRVGETALAAAIKQHDSEQMRLKSHISELEPLRLDVADRDSRLEGWQKRMDGAMQDKDTQIAALRADLGGHRTKLEALSVSLAASAAEKLTLDGQLADSKKSIEAWESHLRSMTTEKDEAIAASQTKAAEASARIKQLENELGIVGSRLAATEAARSQAVETLTGRESALASAQAYLSESAKHQEVLRGQIAQLQANLDEGQRQLLLLQASAQSMKQALDGKDQEILSHLGRVNELEPRLLAHVERLGLVESQLADRDQSVAGLKAKVGELQPLRGLLADREIRLAGREQTITDLNQKITTLQKDASDLHAKLDHAALLVTSRDGRIAGLQAEHQSKLHHTTLLINSRDARISELEGTHLVRLNEAKSHAASLVGSFEAKIAELEAAHLGQLAEHKSQTGLVVTSRDARIAELEASHVAKLAAMKSELSHAAALIQSRDSRIVEWEAAHANKIAELKSELSHAAALIQSRDSRIVEVEAAHASKIAELKSELSHAAALIQSRDARIDDLEGAHTARIIELKRLMSDLQSAFSEKDTRIAELEAQTAAIAEYEGRMTLLRDAIGEKEARISELEASYVARLAEFERTVSERDLRLTELEAIHSSNAAEYEHHNGQLKSQLADLESAHSDRVITFENLIAELRGSISQKDSWISQVDAANSSHIAELKNSIAGLRVELAEKDRSAAEFSKTVDLLRTSITQHESKIAQLDATWKSSISDKEAATAQIYALEIQLADALRQQDEIERALGASQVANQSAAEMLSVYMARFAEMETAHAVLVESQGRRLSELQAVHDALRIEKTQLIEWYEDRLKEVQQTAVQVVAPEDLLVRDQRIDQLRSQVAALTSQLAAETEERNQEMAEAEALVSVGLEAKNREIENLRAELGGSLRQNGSGRDHEIHHLRSTVSQWEERFARVNFDGERRESELRSRIAARDEELSELRSQVSDRDERIEAWETRFQDSAVEWNAKFAELQRFVVTAPLAMAASAGFASRQTVTVAEPSKHSQAMELRSHLANKLHLKGVQFLPGSSELIPESLPILQQAADALHEFNDVTVEIAGHTDSWGDPHGNLVLSRQRAAAVKEFLMNRGIPGWRLIDAGYGDTKALEWNDTPEGRFANRRIEFHVRG